jgi:hypothetical protein
MAIFSCGVGAAGTRAQALAVQLVPASIWGRSNSTVLINWVCMAVVIGGVLRGYAEWPLQAPGSIIGCNCGRRLCGHSECEVWVIHAQMASERRAWPSIRRH